MRIERASTPSSSPYRRSSSSLSSFSLLVLSFSLSFSLSSSLSLSLVCVKSALEFGAILARCNIDKMAHMLLGLLLAALACAAVRASPNIILLLTDDQGYSDLVRYLRCCFCERARLCGNLPHAPCAIHPIHDNDLRCRCPHPCAGLSLLSSPAHSPLL